MALVVTDQSVAELAPNEKALIDARGLVQKGALRNLAKNEDGTLVFGACQGSGSSPYQVSADLDAENKPILRCTCPSRQFPCKHALALMLAFLQKGPQFPVQAPPADLLAKRAARAEKAQKAEKKPAETKSVPRNVNKTAQLKKAKEQTEALDTLESFLVDLVTGGLGGLTEKSIATIDNQAKRMADADMKKTAAVLTRMSAFLSTHPKGDDDDEDDEATPKKGVARGLGEAEETRLSWMLTQLYATVRRGKKALEGKLLEEGTTQSEADAQLESILGRAWRLPELKEAGYWIQDRKLVELAHERTDDDITEFASAVGYMLDLEDGSISAEISALPYHALFSQKLRASRSGTLEIREAALYPGDVVNRRVRWDEKTEGLVRERSRHAADYEALHRHAKSLDTALKAMRNQLKNPLHPLEAVFLVAAKRFGMVGSDLVMEDEAGTRLILRDSGMMPLPSTGALRHAAAAFGPGSLAVRLYFDLPSRSIYGDPLALFVDTEHLRLRA